MLPDFQQGTLSEAPRGTGVWGIQVRSTNKLEWPLGEIKLEEGVPGLAWGLQGSVGGWGSFSVPHCGSQEHLLTNLTWLGKDIYRIFHQMQNLWPGLE